MITFPLPDGKTLNVIEPGNLARLNQGRPMHINGNLVCFTPDLQKFAEHLGVKLDVLSGERVERSVKLTPEQIDAALKACQRLPEIER